VKHPPRTWIALTALMLLLLVGCSGRTPVAPGYIPAATDLSLEDEQYGHAVLAAVTKTYPISHDRAAVLRVRSIADKLTRAAGADAHPWHIYVLEGDAVVNAAATRGNHLFVWTGMLRTASTDGELATVIAHELGHVLAQHTKPTPGEEAARVMADTSGTIAGQIVRTQPGYASLAQLAAILVSEGVKAIAVNPNSQRLEYEADHIGFFMMADAGYNPREALRFWSKMANVEGVNAPGLEFFSSHPATQERLSELESLLPEAEARFYGIHPSPSAVAPATADDSFAIERADGPQKHVRKRTQTPRRTQDGYSAEPDPTN
jgi:predicted Zn-dependent protease